MTYVFTHNFIIMFVFKKQKTKKKSCKKYFMKKLKQKTKK